MRILCFAQLKDVTGCAGFDLEVGGRIQAEELWRRLLERYPGLAPYRPSVRLARNQVYAGPEEMYENADEVALIPPVSGG